MTSNKIFIYIFVFFTGAVVMSVEMAASRILAPYFGASLYIWANIIAVILAGLTIGYFWGGKISEKNPKSKFLFRIVLVAGIFLALIPLFSPYLLSFLSNFSFTVALLIMNSLFGSLIIFFPPSVLLGFVLPYATRMLTEKVEESGKIAGSLYAISTIGSIIGIFSAAFISIPYIGSKETILISAFVLIILTVIGLRTPFLILLISLPLFSNQLSVAFFKNNKNAGIVYQKESPYNLIKVIKADSKKMLATNNTHGFQSILDENKILTGFYSDLLMPLPFLTSDEKNKDILLIGVAGGVAAKMYYEIFDRFFSDKFTLTIDGVEIDKEMINVAKNYFSLNPKTNIIIADGRQYLKTTNKKYDIIIMDAYSDMNLPFHLTTKEFFETAKNSLKGGGILVANVAFGNMSDSLLSSIAKTMASSGLKIKKLSLPRALGSNVLILGSEDAINQEKINLKYFKTSEQLEKLAKYVKENISDFDYDKKYAFVFTDNRAPIEKFTPEILKSLLVKKQ